MPQTLAPKRVSKSILSMYLRTKCDRELYLSLHRESTLREYGMPEPLKARPGIGVLQTAGQEFEQERNACLTTAFGTSVVADRNATGEPVTMPLRSLLNRVVANPSFLLQGKIEPQRFQRQVLGNIGVPAAEVPVIPPIEGLIPDIVLVRAPAEGDEEVLPSGARSSIDARTETRRSLCVLDIKHTSEANPSYSAEVALYALFLSNWLRSEGLESQYFVSSAGYLWTRFKKDEAQLELAVERGATHPDLVTALLQDCEDANLRFYLATAVRFFREDLPRVITIGDARVGGWADLEWHVDTRCSACDWLGHEGWASASDQAKIAAHPDHYCFTCARATGHLSRIAGITRGARKVLQLDSIVNTAGVETMTEMHPTLQKHTFLKKEGRNLPERARALSTSATTIDATAVLATLAAWPQMHLSVAVNFDPSAGTLTGLCLGGVVTTYTRGVRPQLLRRRAFVVDQKSLDAEWVALEGFLTAFSDAVDQSVRYVTAQQSTPLTAQVGFWERRQFEELCAAVGRHLPKVLALKTRKTRALAWLFPADELLEKPEGAVSPCVVFIDEIVRRVVFAPTPHVITLFDTSAEYFNSTPITMRDPYYREFLTNGIPRERIYEIWSNSTMIRRGTQAIPRNTAIADFSDALELQIRALQEVTEKLRNDFHGQLKASAPKLDLTVPQGAQRVAFDAKLWIWWEELAFNTRKLEAHQRLALDARTLEANYEAIRLQNGSPTGNPNEFVFDVRAGSTEAKFDEDQTFLALGKEGQPGFPLNPATNILPNPPPAYAGNADLLRMPLWSSLAADLVSFDRSARRAVIRFTSRDPSFVPYLLAHSTVDLMSDVFLLEGRSSFKWFEVVTSIFRAVQNPSIAVPDPNTAFAMGANPGRAGTDPVTPVARVLWDAGACNRLQVIPQSRAEAIARDAATRHRLNSSQQAAVENAAGMGLSVIWGPPGTGKTGTLASFVHCVARDAVAHKEGLNLLVTGPTYKAVEELIGRVIDFVDIDPACACEVFVGYSASREPTHFSHSGHHFNVTSFRLVKPSAEAQSCLTALNDSKRVTIVATACMQPQKFADWLSGSILHPIFDVAVIDESSQVAVTQAVAALATLKSIFRLVVAGDHLQMPPILALEAPKNAEYLVGSVQQYLLKRRFSSAVQECPLEFNYRSAGDIVAFARTIGYRETLVAVFPDTALHYLVPLPNDDSYPPNLLQSSVWNEVLLPARKTVALLHDDSLSSQGNEVEAKFVASLVWALRQSVSAELEGQSTVAHFPPTPERFWSKCVGIVTPHRAQRALVARELKTVFPSEVSLIDDAIDTVEKFQGGERHTIFVTFGVGDADVIAGEEAFLMQLERTNVAISRAMAKCIVIMPTTLAGHIPQDKRALETAHAVKGYVDEFCNQELEGIAVVNGISRSLKLRYRA